jgi:lysophospholipase L1-like esterase
MGFTSFAAPLGYRPGLYTATGLQIWRAARGLADAVGATVVPVICLGDSITWGIGSDNTTSTPNATAITNCFPARLQDLFAASPITGLQNPGEGFIFANDSRVTVGGSPVQSLYACTLFGQGYRLVGSTQTLTITIPTGVTSIGVIQGNTNAAFNSGGSGLADVTGLYQINSGGFSNLTALTGTNIPIVTNIAVAGGNTFEVEGPATAQTYISGFILNNSVTNGIQVHRGGLNGAVSGSLLGGQNNGVLSQTAANQIIAARACYRWAPTPGLIIVQFSVNDQQFQNGGGTASQNGVTIALYTAWQTQFALQAIADGWDVIFVGGPNDAGYAPGYPTLDQYIASMRTVASANPTTMAQMAVGDMWGGYANSQALGVQVSGSVHPNKAGCLDVAQMIFGAIMGYASNGITYTSVG